LKPSKPCGPRSPPSCRRSTLYAFWRRPTVPHDTSVASSNGSRAVHANSSPPMICSKRILKPPEERMTFPRFHKNSTMQPIHERPSLTLFTELETPAQSPRASHVYSPRIHQRFITEEAR
jgi:hypothetical protein